TADVYAINASTGAKMSGLAGSGGLDNAYSQLAAVPGVVSAIGLGWDNGTLSIRGGKFQDAAYEFDGVPVNRSFDNYPATELATLGQQELQVYTGGAPVGTSANGIAGFVNQVIRNGTYPGFAEMNFGVGGPALYNKFDIQAGGATPDRNFTYFVGLQKSSTSQRLADQFNGASLTNSAANVTLLDFKVPPGGLSAGCNPATNPNYASYTICYAQGVGPFFGPSGYILGPWTWDSPATAYDSQNVINLHFGIPHSKDAGKDDIQVLFDNSYQLTNYYNTLGDMLPAIQADCAAGGPIFANVSCTGPIITAPSGLVYQGPTGVALPASATSRIVPYAFPDCSLVCQPGINAADGQQVGQSIEKLQYQHNFGSTAYLRVYGYSFYSWWYNHGAVGTAFPFVLNQNPMYDLDTHTRGVSATFADQLNDKNLFSVDASVVHATSTRYNNSTYNTGPGSTLSELVSSANPLNGLCYNLANTAVPVSCEPGGGASRTTFGAPLPTTPAPAGFEYLVVENGNHGFLNQVVPTFTSFDINDDLQASEHLKFSLGLRLDNYQFLGSNTQGLARTFWFNAWNQVACVSTAPGSTPFFNPAGPGAACPAGTKVATMVNTPSDNKYNETEPRVAFTYSTTPNDVFRGEYAVSAQPANAAYQQYNTAQQNLPNAIAPSFYQYGFNSPSHVIPPQVAYNTDVSWEHHFNGSDVSFKLTPYLRKTKDESQNIVISFATNFASGLPIGNSTDTGVEFALTKGDFNANGFSGMLSYTHENNVTRYSPLPNGNGSLLSSINNAIKQYNGYTSACAAAPTRPICGATATGAAAAPCYTAGGAPDPGCAAGDIANPYWNAPPRGLFDLYGTYPTEQLGGFFPNANIFGSIPTGVIPNYFTAVLNFRHGKLDLTPTAVFTEGNAYGSPLVAAGIAPDLGFFCSNGQSPTLTGSTTGDPRYPYGAAGGSPFNATCFAPLGGVPDPVTHNFDSFGTFRNPSNINLGMQISYDVSPHATAQFQLINVYNRCFGGASEPWTKGAGEHICGYVGGGNGFGYGANFYNPNSTIDPGERFPYVGANGGAPFFAVFDLKFKM
ncbi:MAG TPA: TonB-dependent receptor, partial [Candidatus Eremiobacteraceae bacterium]|nr:TonB-dependent receptor [Candidatus Eremiobacteraceae bacterium]